MIDLLPILMMINDEKLTKQHDKQRGNMLTPKIYSVGSGSHLTCSSVSSLRQSRDTTDSQRSSRDTTDSQRSSRDTDSQRSSIDIERQDLVIFSTVSNYFRNSRESHEGREAPPPVIPLTQEQIEAYRKEKRKNDKQILTHLFNLLIQVQTHRTTKLIRNVTPQETQIKEVKKSILPGIPGTSGATQAAFQYIFDTAKNQIREMPLQAGFVLYTLRYHSKWAERIIKNQKNSQPSLLEIDTLMTQSYSYFLYDFKLAIQAEFCELSQKELLNYPKYQTSGETETNSQKKEELKKHCPHIENLRILNELLTHFISTRLLSQEEERARATIAGYFLKMAENVLNSGNFFTCQAIANAFTLRPIAQLMENNPFLQEEEKQLLETLKLYVNPRWKEFVELLDTHQPQQSSPRPYPIPMLTPFISQLAGFDNIQHEAAIDKISYYYDRSLELKKTGNITEACSVNNKNISTTDEKSKNIRKEQLKLESFLQILNNEGLITYKNCVEKESSEYNKLMKEVKELKKDITNLEESILSLEKKEKTKELNESEKKQLENLDKEKKEKNNSLVVKNYNLTNYYTNTFENKEAASTILQKQIQSKKKLYEDTRVEYHWHLKEQKILNSALYKKLEEVQALKNKEVKELRDQVEEDFLNKQILLIQPLMGAIRSIPHPKEHDTQLFITQWQKKIKIDEEFSFPNLQAFQLPDMLEILSRLFDENIFKFPLPVKSTNKDVENLKSQMLTLRVDNKLNLDLKSRFELQSSYLIMLASAKRNKKKAS